MIDTPASPEYAVVPDRTRAARRWYDLSERWIIGGVIALVLPITALPYLYGYLSSPPERRFQGIIFDVPDTVQYFSWLRDHRNNWLVPNRMTAEPNPPALFNLLWLIVGRLQVVTGWSIPALFQGLRFIAGTALLLMLYPVIARFTSGRAERLNAYLLIILGAGLGWIWVIVKYARGMSGVPFPLDVYVAEPNTLLVIAAFPHFAVATTLILAIFWCFLRILDQHSRLVVVGAATLALLLTLQHAYDLLIISLVPAGALALIWLRDRRIPWFGGVSLALIGSVAAPPALYFTWITSRDPMWRQVLAQFANAGVYTPSPLHLLVLIGLPLLVVIGAAIYGIFTTRGRPEIARALKTASNADLLLLAWLLVGFLLLYIPSDFQIHMLTAWQVPVGIFAVRLLHRQIMPAIAHKWARLAQMLPVLLLLAVLPTNLYLLIWRGYDLNRHAAPYYLSRGEESALRWLGVQATRADVVLSGLDVGQYVPVYSDARTFLGHWAQTVAYYDKQARVSRFFAAATPEAERSTLLRRFAVTYVVYGAEERALGQFDPGGSALFVPVFRAEDVTIYGVR
ncbi:MAG: hypothetical protein WCF99_02820 [Chloroflexales bacterium]